MKIGTKIKMLRDKSHMSQGVLAEKLGIGQTTLGNIESGLTKKMDFLLIDKICKTFDVDFNYFIEKSNQKLVNMDSLAENGHLAESQIFNFPEKLIQQYEIRLKEKDEIIFELKEENKILKNRA